ncbi:UAA transporter [Sistotremastrum suecicum HHB10207 ss-3]|uniref:UAA transporter n=1 Tax=Sistotremastrum suecicum HHB10207 ss-3 TaxID=1314776 RepID=A0A166E9U6_9AGAM|nr:UAA transporter [Sistotremastrum suecicum HHB10207 ss-3]
MSHRRPHVETSASHEDSPQQIREIKRSASGIWQLAHVLVDWTLVLSLVFGGCCTNAFTWEQLLRQSSSVGTALTVSQMTFISLQRLPSFIIFTPIKGGIPWPRLKPRAIPIYAWFLQVTVLAGASVLNNRAFLYNVPVTIQIIFRSAGLVISMIFGYLFLKKRYNIFQIASVLLVSVGVVVATLSRPASGPAKGHESPERYAMGITFLVCSSLLTGIQGMLQEQTYSKYGPHWQEGLFYTNLLAIPLFMPFWPSILTGLRALARSTGTSKNSPIELALSFVPLVVNLCTQLFCVAGVNQLTSRVSSVSTNLVLTSRKAVSLMISVWWFGSGWNAQLGLGASMVFLGSIFYALSGQASKPKKVVKQVKTE